MSGLPVASRLKAPSSKIGKPSSPKCDVVPRSGIKPPSSSETPQKNASGLKQPLTKRANSGDLDKNEMKPSGLSPPSGSAFITPRGKPTQSKIAKTTLQTPVLAKRESTRGISKKQSGSSSSLNKEIETPVLSREKTQESIKDVETGILFKIGDRVLVSGTKAGVIEYLGETKFAKGFWAGVKLDEPTGKNNGSVAGVKYFDCEPLHGVFSKVNRLHKINIVRDKKPSISDFKLEDNSVLKIGDSVIVSGTKIGILRYLGPTEFAKGEWAGVELKEPLGKNDGAVAGTSYFTCEPNYGLFAPAAKVTRSRKSIHRKSSNTALPPETSLANAAKSVFSNRTGSLSSDISDVPTSPTDKPAITVKGNKLTSPNESFSQSLKKTQTTTRQVAALQSALEEREREIHKMLTETEKTEKPKISEDTNKENNSEDVELVMREKDDCIQTLKTELQKLKAQNSAILVSLEEEKKKYEDLQFMLEEEKITDAELKSHVQEDEGKIKELSDQTNEKTKRIMSLQRELQEARADNISNEAKILELQDEVQQLQQSHDLTNNVDALNNVGDVVKLNRELNDTKKELRKKSEQVNDLENKLRGQVNQQNEVENEKMLSEKLAKTEIEKKKAAEEWERMKLEKEKVLEQLLLLKNEKNEVENRHKLTAEKLDLVEKQHKDLLQTNSVLATKRDEAAKATSLSLNATILDLEDQISKSKMKISDLESDMTIAAAESQQKIKRLESLLSNTKKELDEQKDETNNKNNMLNEMENKLKTQITRQKEIENEVEHLDKADKNLTLMKEAHRSEIDAFQSKINTLTETVASLKKKRENMIVNHKNELEKLEMSKNEENKKLKERIAELETEKLVASKECDTIKQENEKILRDLTQLQNEHDETKKCNDTMCEKLEELENKCQELSRTKEQLTAERSDAIQLCEDQDQQLDILKREKEKAFLDRDSLSQEKGALSTRAAFLEKEIKTLNAESSMKQEEIQQAKETEIKILKAKLEEVVREKETTDGSVGSLKGQTKYLEIDIQEKVVEINKLRVEQETLLVQSMQLENQVNDLKKAMMQENERARQRVKGLENEISVLKEDVDEAQDLVKVKNEDIQGYKEQVGMSGVNKFDIEKLRGESIPKSPMDGDILENASTLLIRLHEAESKLAVLQSDKETAEEQVEFLNSVIVDLQTKNEKANQTIALLEAGDDAVMIHGLDSDSDDEMSSKPKFAMRKFCDICDVFDEHDTDDCPLQSGDHNDSTGGIQHHGNRSDERPYCGICEAFGHWSEDCDDEQTF